MLLEKAYVLPPQQFGPRPDFYPDPVKMPNLYYTWRLFPCRCGVRTGWRFLHDDTQYLVCSIECLELVLSPVADTT